MLRLLPIILSFILMGAHFLRFGAIGLTLMCVTAPLALLIRRKWIVNVFTILLLFSALDWISTAYDKWAMREAAGQDSTRMLIILLTVALFSAGSSLMFRTKKLSERYNANTDSSWTGTLTFLLTFSVLFFAEVGVMEPKLILLERFFFAGGCLQAFWLAIYAGFLADFMQNPLVSQYLRRKIWLFFGVVFFAQLMLGVFGLERFLMTGKLSVPIPITILLEPLYKNTGWMSMFSVFLLITVVTGPSWCSYLCYFGAFDDMAACKKKSPGTMPKWRILMQSAILIAVILTILIIRYIKLEHVYANYLAGVFGLGGIAVILFWSRKTGVMTHCTSYCPIGLLATTIGRVSPFKIKIDDSCDSCGECEKVCRYDALTEDDIKQKAPGGSCTLCGDCISACEKESIDYRLPIFSPEKARTLFIILVISLHAIFLGLVRI